MAVVVQDGFLEAAWADHSAEETSHAYPLRLKAWHCGGFVCFLDAFGCSRGLLAALASPGRELGSSRYMYC